MSAANDNERIHRLVEENTQWRIRFEGLEQRLREMSEEDTNTDRHRLQISVLQERVIKQEQQLAQLQLRPTPQSSVNQSLNESVIAKISHVKSIETKLRENIQRLVKSVSLFFPFHCFHSLYFYCYIIVWSNYRDGPTERNASVSRYKNLSFFIPPMLQVACFFLWRRRTDLRCPTSGAQSKRWRNWCANWMTSTTVECGGGPLRACDTFYFSFGSYTEIYLSMKTQNKTEIPCLFSVLLP